MSNYDAKIQISYQNTNMFGDKIHASSTFPYF